ncbi:hypothetical protein TNCV_3480221 [Trichonephila clavipes]|nr:hypothetical protein TNCV_3480221 [Trichonephila clavipes]
MSVLLSSRPRSSCARYVLFRRCAALYVTYMIQSSSLRNSRPPMPQRKLWKVVNRSCQPSPVVCQFTGPIMHGLLLESHEEFGVLDTSFPS